MKTHVFNRIFLLVLTVAIISTTVMIPVHAAPSISLTVAQDYVLIGKTVQVTATTNPSGLTVTWTSSDPSIATVNSSGLVTGVDIGQVTIVASCTDSNGVSASWYTYITVGDDTGIVNNTAYHIKNRYYNRYISLATATDSDGINIIGSTSKATTSQKWTLSKQSDGKHKIISAYSSSGRVLGVSGTENSKEINKKTSLNNTI